MFPASFSQCAYPNAYVVVCHCLQIALAVNMATATTSMFGHAAYSYHFRLHHMLVIALNFSSQSSKVHQARRLVSQAMGACLLIASLRWMSYPRMKQLFILLMLFLLVYSRADPFSSRRGALLQLCANGQLRDQVQMPRGSQSVAIQTATGGNVQLAVYHLSSVRSHGAEQRRQGLDEGRSRPSIGCQQALR